MTLSERTKNTIVGLTVLIGLTILVAGMIFLDKLPSLKHASPYSIVLRATNAAGLSAGNKVDFNGVVIGTVSNVTLTPDLTEAILTLNITSDIGIPANAVATVGKQTIGSAFISLSLPTGEAPSAPLPKDGSGTLIATVADPGLIPKPVIDTLTRVGNSVEELLQKKPLSEFEKEDPNTRIANISILVQRLDRVARGVDVLVGDPQSQQQVRNTIKNIEASSAQLRDTLKNVDTVISQAHDTVGDFRAAATQASSTLKTTEAQVVLVTGKMADVLQNLEKTTAAINKGEGTAGKLINDPRLYESMVDLSVSLKSTTDDLNVLLRKWKEEGVRFNLK